MRPLSPAQAIAIERAGLADVVAGPSSGFWEVRTGSRVGVVVGDDWELRVSPRINVPQLMFLLAYAQDQRGWKRTIAGFGPEDELFVALASGFSWHATWAIDRGLLRGYVRREESRNDVRGRILFGDQIARAAGLPLPILVAYDDFTQDVLENRMLQTAAQLFLRLPRVPAQARQRLLRLRASLEGVSPLVAWRGVKAPLITRLNQRYEAALRLAELVLAGASVNDSVGDVRSTTFVFDMNKVFEDFLTVAFREAMRAHGGEVRSQISPYSLDEDGTLSLKPDISWWVGGRCVAVLDAKYKAVEEGVMRHPDAYQMLAYCTSYGLNTGYLCYAKDSGAEARTHRVRNSPYEIVVTTIDVGKRPEEVLVDVAALASRVVREAPHATPLKVVPAA